jgi:hypothetical protein
VNEDFPTWPVNVSGVTSEQKLHSAATVSQLESALQLTESHEQMRARATQYAGNILTPPERK